MDLALISLILTSITAIAAVIGPIISSIINVRSNERTKRYEIYSVQIYAAVQKFTEAYSQFPRMADFEAASPQQRTVLSREAAAAYREFSAAAYAVMSFLPNPDIHGQAVLLLEDLDGSSWITIKHDQAFEQLSEQIALELAADASPKKNRIARKAKRSNRK